MPEVSQVVVVEVTNTVQARAVTGYQRFVRELLRSLPGPGLEVVPVVWDRGYRRLLPFERRALASGWSAPSLPAKVLRRVARRLARPYPVPNGAVFLDAEPAWHDPEPRATLLPALRERGVRVVAVVTDVLPELRPEWFEPRVRARFHDWLTAHLAHAESFLAISAYTQLELERLGARDVAVVPLGADVDGGAGEQAVELPFVRFLLVVGTLEPRKNHDLVLDLLARLDDTDLGVVLVGKPGWLVDDLLARVTAAQGDRLVWLSGLGDPQLTWLYRHAFLALVPSWSEGLGLPLLEAVHHGLPAIASTGGALLEAGLGVAEHAAPDDLDTWEKLVRAHLEDPDHHAERQAVTRATATPTWAATGTAVRERLT